MQTFIFAVYFTEHVAATPAVGASLWGIVNALSALLIACLAPCLGAAADYGKKRKVWLFFLTISCVLATFALFFVQPDSSFTLFALFTVGLAIVASELAFVFYNAMLPSLAPRGSIGKWSGWGWSLGYIGGVASLLLAYLVSVFLQHGKNDALPVRWSFVIAACWYLVFSFPLFFYVPDTSGKGQTLIKAVRSGLQELKHTFQQIRAYKNIAIFLLARMSYIDALHTLFVFGGIFAASLFGFNTAQILYLGIALNLSAGVGALIFSWVDDKIGGKQLILISIAGLFVPTVGILFTTSPAVFWLMAITLGIFVGPLQAASRSYMANVSPPQLRNEMFGFFAFSGKATSFLGPLFTGWISYLTGSLRSGIAVVLVLLTVGFILTLYVKNDYLSSPPSS